MLSKVKKIWNSLTAIDIFTSNSSTIIIQAYPKKNVLYVSHKGKVKSAYFRDDTMRHMLKGNQDFKKHTDRFLTTVGQLLQQIINDK